MDDNRVRMNMCYEWNEKWTRTKNDYRGTPKNKNLVILRTLALNMPIRILGIWTNSMIPIKDKAFYLKKGKRPRMGRIASTNVKLCRTSLIIVDKAVQYNWNITRCLPKNYRPQRSLHRHTPGTIHVTRRGISRSRTPYRHWRQRAPRPHQRTFTAACPLRFTGSCRRWQTCRI